MALDKTKLSDGNTYEDFSKLLENNLTGFRLSLTMKVPAIFPATHANGKLENKTYVIGRVEAGTVIYNSSFVVSQVADAPVRVDVGTLDAPKRFVDSGAMDGTIGTTTVINDCNFYAVSNTPIIATVTGSTADISKGLGVIALDASKVGHKTYYPS